MGKAAVKITNFDTNREYLSSSETIELLKKYQATGQKHYKDQIVEGNIGLVLKVLQKWRNVDDVNEVFQIGCIGLIKAVERFDIDKGYAFSTYAVPMVNGEIYRWNRDNKDLPRRFSGYLREYQKIKTNNPNLSDEEIAQRIGIEAHELTSLLDFHFKDSLNRKIFDDNEERELGNLISAGSFESDATEIILMSQILKRLSEKERKVIRLSFFEDETQAEIGEKIGVSQAQVSRIKEKVLKKMKKYYEGEESIMKTTTIEDKIKTQLKNGETFGLDDYGLGLLKLRLLEEKSYAKMGKALEVSNGTVYRHYDDVLQKVKSKMKDEEVSDQEVDAVMNIIAKKEKEKPQPVKPESKEEVKEAAKVEEPKEVIEAVEDYIALLICPDGTVQILKSTDGDTILKVCELFRKEDNVRETIACKKIG